MENQKNEKQMTHTPPQPAQTQPPAQTPPPAPKPVPMQQPQPEQFNEPTVADKSSKSKKIKIGIIVAACVVAVAGLIFLIAGLISNNTKLATPTGLEVVETTTGKTYLCVDKCSGAVKYKFEVLNTETNTTKILESEKNNIDATLILGKPANYKVTCQYIGKTTKNTSNYCEKLDHKTTKKIATPTIELGTYNGHNVLFVETANSFAESVSLNFTLHYTKSQLPLTYTFFENLDSNSSGYVRGCFNLDNVFLTKGEQYQLAVQVSATEAQQEFYKVSDLSKQQLYKVV